MVADLIREAAANAGPTPGNTKLNQVQDEMARLNQWSGRDYEGEIPVTGPIPITAEAPPREFTAKLSALEKSMAEIELPLRRIPGMTGEGT